MAINDIFPNNCHNTIGAALRFLAHNDRPSGGEQFYNSIHLLQLADEFDDLVKRLNPVDPHYVIIDEEGRFKTDNAFYTTLTFSKAAVFDLEDLEDSIVSGDVPIKIVGYITSPSKELDKIMNARYEEELAELKKRYGKL